VRLVKSSVGDEPGVSADFAFRAADAMPSSVLRRRRGFRVAAVALLLARADSAARSWGVERLKEGRGPSPLSVASSRFGPMWRVPEVMPQT